MAKRTKLNLRAMMVLSIVLIFLVGGATAWRLGKRIKPRDPAGLAHQAQMAANKNDLATAAKLMGEALGGADDNIDYFIEAIRIYLDWAKAPTLNDTEKAFRIKQASGLLEVAIQKAPDNPQLRMIQADMQWDGAIKTDNWDGWTRFVETARQALRTQEDPEARYRLAIANLRRSELRPELLDDALADFGRAAKEGKKVRYWLGGPDRDDRNLTLQGYLPVVLNRKPAAAAEAVAEAIQNLPDSADIRVACGDYYLSTNQPKLALDQYMQALQRQSANVISKLAIARFYMIQGEPEKSLEYAEQARKEHPDDYRTYLELSNVLNSLGRRDEAIKVLREGVIALENWTATQPVRNAWITKRTGIIELNYALAGSVLDKVGSERSDKADLTEAQKCLARLGELEPDSFQYHQIAGRLAIARGQISRAVGELEAAFSRRDYDTRTAGLLFDLYMSQGLPGKAENLVGRMEKSPRLLGSAFVSLCKALLAINSMDYDAAIAQLFRIKDRDAIGAKAQELLIAVYRATGRIPSLPGDFKASRQSIILLCERADYLWRHDQHGKAVEMLEELMSRAPDDLSVTSELMRMYLDVGQLDKARDVLKRAIASHPGDHQLMNQWDLLNEPDPAKRFEMQLAIAGQNPDPLAAELRKAEICEIFGRKEQSLEYLQAAEKISPDNPAVIGELFNHALEIKNWKTAEELASRAAKANIDGLGGLLFRGRLAIEQDQPGKAVQAFRQIVSERPDNKIMRVMLAQAYLNQYAKTNSAADLAAAQEAFKTVLAIDPVYAPALIGMAQTAQKMGKRAEEENWIRKAWRVAPDEPYVREKYLELPEIAANPLELVARRQSMMEKNPGDLENVAALARLLEDPRVDRPDEAEKLYQIIYHQSPDKLAAANLLIGFLVREGKSSQADQIFKHLDADQKDRVGVLVLRGAFLSNYNPVQARDAFEQAVQADPKDPRGYRGLALLSIAVRDWPQAVKAMEKLLELDPNDKAVQKDLILCMIEADMYEEAAARIQAILAVDPADVVAMTDKGLLLLRKGDYAGAMETLTSVSRMSPSYAQPLAYRAQLYAIEGDLPKAIEDLKTAASLSADPAIAMDLAVMYRQAWQLENAQNVCKDVLTEHANYAPAAKMLAGLYLLTGKWEELNSLLQKTVETFPADPSYLIIMARMYQLREDKTARLAALQEALRKFPSDAAVRIEYLQGLADMEQYQHILDYLHENPADSAIVVEAGAIASMAELKLDRSAEARVQSAFAGLLKQASPANLGFTTARIQQAFGQAGAADRTDIWLSARPGDWRMMFLAANLLSAAGRFDKAAEMFDKALQAADSNQARIEIELARAESLQKAGDSRKAADACARALELAPTDIRCLNNLAFILVDRLNDAQRALELIQKAYRLAPGMADVMDTYGWTFARLGQYEDAVGKLDPICQVFSPKPVYLYHLGYVWQKLGQAGKARECFQKALGLAKGKDKELCDAIEQALGQLQGRGD